MRALICLLTAAVLAGCGASTDPTIDISLAPTSNDVAGAFNLISANGTAPPFNAFATATQGWTLVSDSLSLVADKTWVESTKYLVTSFIDNSTSTQYTVVSGTYLIANGKINFTMTQGGTSTFIGSVTANTLTMVFNNTKFVYTKSS